MAMRIRITTIIPTDDGLGRSIPMIAVIGDGEVRHEYPGDEDTLIAAEEIRAGLREEVEE
tara:strand:+ start:35 stop:214 length:180 start_codon:yes stop_codon:yes gene_type:complete